MDAPDVVVVDYSEEFTGVGHTADLVFEAVGFVLEDFELLIVVVEPHLGVRNHTLFRLVNGRRTLSVTFVLAGVVELLDVQEDFLEVLLPLQDAGEVFFPILILNHLRQKLLQVSTRFAQRLIFGLFLFQVCDYEDARQALWSDGFNYLPRLLVSELFV